ncbi:MAG: hypothetical protein WDO69_18545 [Pseudomonadota bacterium]
MNSRKGIGMNAGNQRIANAVALTLGVTMFMFGFLKFFEPFHSWFQVQIANSHLPAPSFAMGIAGELSIGTAFIVSVAARARLGRYRQKLVVATCLGLILNMCVATYVHLQPSVPAGVLPLGIKPPIIPLSFLALAVWELVLVTRLRAGKSLAPTEER